MYYAFTSAMPPRIRAAYVRFPSELERDSYVTNRPDTRQPCDPPEDTSGFRPCGIRNAEMRLEP